MNDLLMRNKISYQRFYEGYIGLFAFVMLVAPKLIAILFAGFVPLIIVGMMRKRLWFRLELLPGLFMLLYLGYLVYAIVTRHPDLAGRYIENKLSFLLLPLFLSFRFTDREEIPPAVDEKDTGLIDNPFFEEETTGPQVFSFRFLAYGFLAGVAFLVIESFIGSFMAYAAKHDYHSFLSSEFSKRHHPSYTAVYYIVAIGLVWYGYRERWKGFGLWPVVLATGMLVVSYGLCLSLAGILYGFAAAGFVFLRVVYRRFGKWTALAAAAVTPLLIYGMIVAVPQFQGEWANAKQYADEYVKDPETFVRNKHYPMSGSEVRLVMWTVSAQIAMDYPLGVGTGNVDEVLTTYLDRMGQTELAKMEYNPHNQYLQTAVELGWAGCVLLIAILVVGCVRAWRSRNMLLLLVITNLAFNMLFESMLQRQSGIVFYTFVICLFYMYSPPARKEVA
jgi:O-antigen ligase